MLKINFESEENSNEERKSCICKKRISYQRTLKRNVCDAAEAVSQVMILCGISEHKARCVIETIVKSLTFFDEIYYRVDRVPRKRFCKEDFMYRLSCCCQFSRKETQLTYAITRRVFRALYFNTRQCGEKIDPNIQTRHSQECVLVHAAKKIAQILAIIEGMFFETQIMFENRIKCVFKSLHDKFQQRAYGYELTQCECPKCREKKSKPNKNKIDQNTNSTSSSIDMPGQQVKFCLKVCAERLKEKQKREGNVMEEVEEVVEKHNIFPKCNCPKLACDPDFESDFRVPSLECGQAPFACNWLPMADDEDICDDICSEPEKLGPCIEIEESSEQDFEFVCDEQNAEEHGERSGEPFQDDFDEATLSLTVSQPSCHKFHCPTDSGAEGDSEETDHDESVSIQSIEGEDQPRKKDKTIKKREKHPKKDKQSVTTPDIFDVHKRKTDKGISDDEKDKPDQERERINKGDEGRIQHNINVPANTTGIKKVDKTDESIVKETDGKPPELRTPKSKPPDTSEKKPPVTKPPDQSKTDKEEPLKDKEPSKPAAELEKEPKTESGKTPAKPDKDTKRVSKVTKPDKSNSPSPPAKKRDTKTDTPSKTDQDETEEVEDPTKEGDVPIKEKTPKAPSRPSKPARSSRPSKTTKSNVDTPNRKRRSSGGSHAGVPPETRRSSAPRSSGPIKKRTPKKPAGKKPDRSLKQNRQTIPSTQSTERISTASNGVSPPVGRTKTGKVSRKVLPCCVCPKRKKKYVKRPKCEEEPSIYYSFED